MEELLHPLLRVPFEKANKSFRLFHKQLTRDVAAVQRQITTMRQEQPAAQHAAVAETIARLEAIADEIRRVQMQSKTFLAEQQREVEACVSRVQFAATSTSHSDEEAPKQKQSKRAQHEARLVADYLLCRGYVDSSRLVQEKKGVGFLVDHEMHVEHQSILTDLHAHNLCTAIAWCAENGSRLRRMQSRLEFQLRLQEFIELVRSDKKLEAIQYAQAHLTPLTMQHEDEETRKSMMDSIQEAMATLAFKSPDQCGVESYSRLFSGERWLMLKDLFRTTFFEVYGIHNPPSLCVALYAGLSTLNTRTCRRTREARAAALKRPAQSGATEGNEEVEVRDKKDAKQFDDGTAPRRGKKIRLVPDNDKDEEDDGEGRDRRRTKRKHSKKRSKLDSSDSTVDAFDDSTMVPLCPTCSEVGGRLCEALPFAHHPHSRLVCRVTQAVMNEHNRPLVLPNGFVYSQQAVDQLTTEAPGSQGSIHCPETRDVFAVSDLKPVYIL
ncbi:hypothetical protein P43SY_000269 [Pythium insidiosum]|uniref:Macrophage erythroblast attacher n=1 Tax=Pythium insidiosum TaxID=114742 RepID=A0AAD5Q8L2_PYTIN|nr:hypothetical protein P43SY_000269 [Pythium insidiosum]